MEFKLNLQRFADGDTANEAASDASATVVVSVPTLDQLAKLSKADLVKLEQDLAQAATVAKANVEQALKDAEAKAAAQLKAAVAKGKEEEQGLIDKYGSATVELGKVLLLGLIALRVFQVI